MNEKTDTCPDCSNIPCDCGLPAGYTPTPRTDKEIQRYMMTHFITQDDDDGYAVKANFARQLERELAAVTEQRDRLAEALESVKCELGVPQPEYPSPVANAYWIADEALQSLNPDHTVDANDMIAAVNEP